MREENRNLVAAKIGKFFLICIVIAIPAAWMTYNVLKQSETTCEVCIEFRGNSQCRQARGESEDTCRRTATDNACAFLSSGMTDSIACGNTEPKSVKFNLPR